jgi:hypothetical protein
MFFYILKDHAPLCEENAYTTNCIGQIVESQCLAKTLLLETKEPLCMCFLNGAFSEPVVNPKFFALSIP